MNTAEKSLHEKFVNYGRNAKLWIRKCVMLLPEIEKHQIWRAKGFGSIYEYAAKLAGMGRDQVNEALRVLAKIGDKPALMKIAETRGINAVKPVVTIATRENAGFWAEKANEMSKNTLETFVREFKKENLFELLPGKEFCTENPQQQAISIFNPADGLRAGGGETGCDGAGSQQLTTTSLDEKSGSNISSHKKIVAMELEPVVLEQLEKLKGRGDWNELMKQLLQMRATQMEEQKPEAVKTESRHIPVKIQRYVFARTNGTCSYPGCTKSTKIKHHTQRFALEKVHDPDRLFGLCKEHERIAHLGLIENEECLPLTWKIKNAADRSAPKFKIDALVAKYRAG
jgi:hypothetical protein